MKITAERLRNLTTGRLHTKMDHIYEDLGAIIGDDGLMTHMLPAMNQAVKPRLKEKVLEYRFWDNEYDPSHVGDYELPEPTKEERAAMFERYMEQPNLLAGKEVIQILV